MALYQYLVLTWNVCSDYLIGTLYLPICTLYFFCTHPACTLCVSDVYSYLPSTSPVLTPYILCTCSGLASTYLVHMSRHSEYILSCIMHCYWIGKSNWNLFIQFLFLLSLQMKTVQMREAQHVFICAWKSKPFHSTDVLTRHVCLILISRH